MESSLRFVTGNSYVWINCFVVTFLFSLETGEADLKNFQSARIAESSSFCAVYPADDVIAYARLTIPCAGRTGIVPCEAKCAWACLTIANCSSFNYNYSAKQCELFFQDPVNFISSNTCQYHQVGKRYQQQISRFRLVNKRGKDSAPFNYSRPTWHLTGHYNSRYMAVEVYEKINSSGDTPKIFSKMMY